MGKLLKKVIIISLIAVLLEVFYFNFSALQLMLGEHEGKNLVFHENDFSFVDWEKQGDTFISTSVDPQVLIGLDGMRINSVLLHADTIPQTDSYQFYYTDEHGEVAVVNGSRSESGLIMFHVNDWSANWIRIDIGDAPGIQLKGVTVTVNPVQWDISLSRIVAIILIYLLGSLLFRIQSMPDYGITLGKEAAHDR